MPQNEASIAGLVLSTEALVAERPEKSSPMPAGGGGGGMPGMGGMGGFSPVGANDTGKGPEAYASGPFLSGVRLAH